MPIGSCVDPAEEYIGELAGWRTAAGHVAAGRGEVTAAEGTTAACGSVGAIVGNAVVSSEAAGMVERQVESGKAGKLIVRAGVAIAVETPAVVTGSEADAALLEA